MASGMKESVPQTRLASTEGKMACYKKWLSGLYGFEKKKAFD